MVQIQLVESVRDQVLAMRDEFPQYETQLTMLAAGEWVFIDNELDFILACELLQPEG
ncbi:MAG: hypothetical protein ACN2B6_00985 [Rickettsiales bacterium]